jgi:SET domain-containing protein
MSSPHAVENSKQDTEWPSEIGNPAGTDTHTTEFSFVLRASPYGVGVFAAHRIRKGTILRLYNELEGASVAKRVRVEDVPGEFIKYCIPCLEQGWVSRPMDFGKMDLVWFLNHAKVPNAAHNEEYKYTALRNIKAGEEIMIDYDTI